jgi:hypothetical protein
MALYTENASGIVPEGMYFASGALQAAGGGGAPRSGECGGGGGGEGGSGSFTNFPVVPNDLWSISLGSPGQETDPDNYDSELSYATPASLSIGGGLLECGGGRAGHNDGTGGLGGGAEWTGPSGYSATSTGTDGQTVTGSDGGNGGGFAGGAGGTSTTEATSGSNGCGGGGEGSGLGNGKAGGPGRALLSFSVLPFA